MEALARKLEKEEQVTVGITNGVGCSILGLVGDTSKVDMDLVASLDIVESVKRVREHPLIRLPNGTYYIFEAGNYSDGLQITFS